VDAAFEAERLAVWGGEGGRSRGRFLRRERELGGDASRKELLGANAAALLQEALDVGQGLCGVGERTAVVGQHG